MARWVAEETIEEIEVQVTMLVPLKKVTVESARLRSPGGQKPMRRTYFYVPTPDVARFDDKMAKDVHSDNVKERAKVDAEFAKAAAEQPRIEARRRDAIHRAKNIEKHGCARGVSRSAKKKSVVIVESPVTVLGGCKSTECKCACCDVSECVRCVCGEGAGVGRLLSMTVAAMCETCMTQIWNIKKCYKILQRHYINHY